MKKRLSRVPPASDWAGKLILFAIVFFVLGSLVVFKENLYLQLSNRLVEFEKKEKALRDEAGHLELKLAQVTEYVTISNRAERELGMISSDFPADTLWITALPETPNYRIMTLFSLPSR